jgi:hypothetical protein
MACEGFAMLRIEGDRRRHERVPLERPCKVYEPRSGRYILASTRDLSCGGLLIDVPRLIDLRPGDTLHIGVAMKRRQGILPAADMVEAVVVRCTPTVDDHTALAVKFNRDRAVPLAFEHRAAA